MGDDILHQGATVQCAHGGQAQPMTVDLRVKVSNQAIVTQSSIYGVSGCSEPPPMGGNGPCATGQFTNAATRVRASGVPVLVKSDQAICAPTGTGLNIISTQTRVKAV